jgi:hypothetical protein
VDDGISLDMFGSDLVDTTCAIRRVAQNTQSDVAFRICLLQVISETLVDPRSIDEHVIGEL